jgi:2-oxoglutarate dehydrogenase E2 component (dihydrolipoamide succinyltransferase)
MPVEVVMPQMGESIFEGTITKWLKKTGDTVRRDEPLLEISTDKVDAEIQSPASGVLKEIKVAEGQTVPIRTVVALIDADASGQGAPSKPAAPESTKEAVASSAAGPAPSKAATETGDESGPISPLVRRLAREHNVDLSTVRGTGAGGRITKQDVLTATANPAAPSPGAPARGAAESRPSSVPAPVARPEAPPSFPEIPHAALETAVPRERIYFGRYQTQPMSIMRQRIAEHMVLSKRVSPHVYSFDEADMTAILSLRDSAKDEFEKRAGTKLSFTPFFVRAAAEALRAFPIVNSSVDGTTIIQHEEINIGIAVALDAGLIVPVLKGADQKDLTALQRAVTDLAERARAKKLHPDEVHESTFSITNPGVFGGLMGLPVINQPNVAILALGAIQKRPVVINDAVVPRSMIYLTLSYDHRVVDGATAHQFLGRIKQRLESWDETIV